MINRFLNFGLTALLIASILTALSLKIQQKHLIAVVAALKEENTQLQKTLNQYEQKLFHFNLESKVSRLRQLPFLNNPVYREVDRDELHQKLLDELQKESSPQEIENSRKVLVKFGFIDPKYNLSEEIVSLYDEQIGAYYDMEEKALFNIKGLPLGKGLNDAVQAHELTHTLQDQNFHIKRLFDKTKDNDDERLAIQALIEGDATYVTQLFYVDSLNITFVWDLISYLFIDQKKFNQAPLVLRENMLFPYVSGLSFVMNIYRNNGWSAVNACFKKPPLSTEEILHPEKYLLGNDPPIKVEMPELKQILLSYHLLEEDVMGEFNIRILFKKFLKNDDTLKMANGWGGDTYQLWEEKDQKDLFLIWISVWDTLKDAEEFYSGYHKLIAIKFPDAEKEDESDKHCLWKASNNWILLSKNEKQVLVIEAKDKEDINKTRNSFEGFKDSFYNH